MCAKEKAGILTSSMNNSDIVTASFAGEQAAHEILIFMDLVCNECEGQGWDVGEAEDSYGHPCEVQVQCQRCDGTGEL